MRQLTVSGLYKAFGTHPVLTGLDLDVPAGSFTAILGPSGSGKTTLLRLLAGFERADAGSIAIGDRVVDGPGTSQIPPERRQLGYVPQEGALFPHLTVAANVGFGLPARRRAARTAELLEAVGLAGMGGRYPHQLSGGQQQRVALARALAIRPEVVLLDEPFASLDAHLRASVRADVLEICRAAGTTAILVTHDQDEALSMADRIAVLRDGRIVQYAEIGDGRCFLTLMGVARFRLVEEMHYATPYRVAHVDYAPFAEDFRRGAGEEEVDRDGLLAAPSAPGPAASWLPVRERSC